MSFPRQPLLSRRNVVASLLTSWTLLRVGSVGAQSDVRVALMDLGHGLEIRDYRLFPTTDVMRFIVEIHNTTDTAVDTPTVGVMLPHLGDGENYGWANPISAVLHPHTSDCLIGVAPPKLTSDSDWDTPSWIFCDEISTHHAKKLAQWDVDFTYSVEFVDTTHARAILEIVNRSERIPQGLILQGIAWDKDHRIAGAMLPTLLNEVEPDVATLQQINVTPTLSYVSNPFNLIDTVEELSITFSLQPQLPIVNRGCPVVMPWNT